MNTKNLKPGNRIILRDTGDLENDLDGGYTSVYDILRCNVGEEIGLLEYERRTFPAIPGFSARVAPALEGGGISCRHVRNMRTLRDEEVAELRDRGVNIKIFRKKQ